jgi:hypothetical protein
MARSLAVYAVACGCLVVLGCLSAQTGIGVVVSVLVGGGLIAYGAIVAWPIGVQTTRTGVVIRGPYGSSTASWMEIERFESSDAYPWSVWLVRADGTRARAWGLGAGRGAPSTKRRSEPGAR